MGKAGETKMGRIRSLLLHDSTHEVELWPTSPNFIKVSGSVERVGP